MSKWLFIVKQEVSIKVAYKERLEGIKYTND